MKQGSTKDSKPNSHLDINPFDMLERQEKNFQSLSDSALRLFQLNFVVIGLFLPLIFLLLREENTPDPTPILNNRYTQFGMFLWLISVMVIISTYYFTQSNAISQHRSVIDHINNDTDYEYMRQYIQDRVDKSAKDLQRSLKILLLSPIISLFSLILIAFGTLFSLVDITPVTSLVYVVLSLVVLSLILLIMAGVYRSGFKWYAILAGIDEIFDTNLEPAAWEKIPLDYRTTIAAIGHLFQAGSFTKEELEASVSKENTSEIFRDKRSINCEYHVLDGLVDRGILEKTAEGETLLIVDLESDLNSNTLINPDENKELERKVNQFLERENINKIDNDELDLHNPSKLVATLNAQVDRTVFEIVAQVPQYNLKSMEGLQILHDYAYHSNDLDSDKTNYGWIP